MGIKAILGFFIPFFVHLTYNHQIIKIELWEK